MSNYFAILVFLPHKEFSISIATNQTTTKILPLSFLKKKREEKDEIFSLWLLRPLCISSDTDLKRLIKASWNSAACSKQ